ncbi:putative 2-dehydropantoate 2-reductase [Holophaga foetida]|uniref:putative 2-dehydropantoate 2-reductase n=1 Tax=Holophaga foetida TaxID=35839 RepID=UPI000247532D|nr:putative 2-dehydropantoate 2-reductase [Holophaga foetida]
MQPTRYAILGTGALGGFYGARLERAGSEVHFLLHSEYDHVVKHGLMVESKEGDFHLPKVNAYKSVEDMPKCDVAIVAWKAVQNHLLPALLPAVLKEDGVVLVLQNGLGVEEAAAAAAPGHRVFGGLCFICSNRVGPGHIRHLDYGSIRMAEHSPDGKPAGISDTLRRIGSDFEHAGIEVSLLDDLILARWQKLVWNIPYNGLSVVLDANTSELMEDPDSLALVEGLMWEVLEGAAACGRVIPGEFVQKMLDMTRVMTPYRASMKIDYDERRAMEVEAIHGAPLRIAEAAGVELPILKTLYHQLKFIGTRYGH